MSVFDLNVSDIFNAIGGGSPLSIINSVLHPEYAIRRHGDSAVALSFSGMVSVAPEGQATIVTAPVEQGKYSSINKVRRCEGAAAKPSALRGGDQWPYWFHRHHSACQAQERHRPAR